MKTKYVFLRKYAINFCLYQRKAIILSFLIAGLLISGSLMATDLRNKLVIEFGNEFYQMPLQVDSDRIVINKEALNLDVELIKIKMLIHDYLKSQFVVKKNDTGVKSSATPSSQQKKSDALIKKLEVVFLDSVVNKIAQQKNAYRAAIAKKVQQEKTDSLKKSESESNLEHVITLLNSDKGDNAVNFSLKDSVITAFVFQLYDCGKYVTLSKEHKVIVKSVKMSVENGIIKDMLIICKDKGDTLSYYPHKDSKTKLLNVSWKDKVYPFSTRHYISLRDAFDIDELNTERANLLVYKVTNDIVASIDLSEVIRALREGTLANGTYTSIDTTFTLPLKEPLVMKKNSIVDNLNLKVFSDMFGYKKNSVNGVIQVEAKINFLLNTVSTTKKSFRNDMEKILNSENRHEWVWINRISPYAKWMRIQNTNTFLSIDSVGKGNVMNLFKYATLDLGIDLNVITYRTDSKLFSANLAGGIWRTRIGENINDTTDSGVWLSTLYLNPIFDFKFYESSRLDFSFGIGGYYAIQLSTLTHSDLSNLKSTLTSYEFNANHMWLQLQGCINFHPNGNWRNSIFLRTNQYWNPQNSHFTFQIGYSTPLSSIFK